MIFPLTMAADNRLILFDQSDFGAKKGWYVAFENQGADGTPLPVESLRLILAFADGKEWHFTETKGFHVGQSLNIQAKIDRDGATLIVDGKQVGKIEAKLAPNNGSLVAGRYPDWASARAGYRLERGAYRIHAEGTTRITDQLGQITTATSEGVFPKPNLERFEKPLELLFSNLGATDDADLSIKITIAPPLTPATGLIDAFGQVIGAEIPNRVKTDADLQKGIAAEAGKLKAWPRDPRLDPFGGVKSATWHEKPTGYFRVVKHGGKWSLVSPQGNPLFYTGLCTAPALRWEKTPVTGREKLFTVLPPKGDLWGDDPWGDDPVEYVSFGGWSLKRKYGADWEAKATASLKRRLDAWGFTGMGKWCDPVPGVPRVDVMNADWPKLVRHLDPFDPKAREAAKASLTKQLASRKNDPWIVGTSIGNEYDEIVTRDEIAKVLSGPDSPAKTALSGLDLEAARKKYASAYYKFLYETVKSLDPNHLYLGFWIVPGWWQDESDWDLIAPYCDVIGYDRYSDSYQGMEQRQKRTRKPTLLGEFSFPAWYGGTRGVGRYNVFTETDADSGRKYGETMLAAAKDPYCVGALWFQYRDEPVTGRGPGHGPDAVYGEHYAFGFIDINDQPKWDLVTRAREANRQVVKLFEK